MDTTSRSLIPITEQDAQEAPHDVPATVWQHCLFTRPIVKTVSPLLEWVSRALVLHPPSSLDSRLDTMANRLYRILYTPQSVHLDTRTWDEGASNEAVMLPLQTPPEISAVELINVILDLKSLPAIRPRNLFPEEVYITYFPPGYHFPMFVIYRGHNDPLKHLRRFICQCRATTESNALPLNQFLLGRNHI